ncbi:MAG: hypothetical protein WC142_07315 [Bacteroidales bacterium]|jgi:hypothetical protein|nr:hypothetical protein [Bacteroidales bacterium]MDD2687760.1 hypothetical protein [Bacteroidales bacterium]MDD3331293.1 hypothetical protein [Bacteroidales bacterium]MDD4045147.1 hypothetical protein [Bacteroidales bacterium]MDD4581878.1 hypothetical protein [Bacteroidales bacterium]
MFKKSLFVVFVVFAFILGSCNPKRQDNLCSMETNTLPELVLEAYNSIDKNTFFELCQRLNDSINRRTDYFYLYTATFINETTNEIGLGIVELDEQVPQTPIGLILHICIIDKNTILMENELIKIDDFNEKAKRFILEPDSSKKHNFLQKKQIESFGEIEVSKVGVNLSINAKGLTLSPEEWTAFFNCLHDLVNIYENERNNIAIKKAGVNFNSLTFEQKKAFNSLMGYPIMLIFDRNCSANPVKSKNNNLHLNTNQLIVKTKQR